LYAARIITLTLRAAANHTLTAAANYTPSTDRLGLIWKQACMAQNALIVRLCFDVADKRLS
jgi:hypothetical protein